MARPKLTRTKIHGIYWYMQNKDKKFAYRYRYYDRLDNRREVSRRGFDSIEKAERALIDVKASILDGNTSFVENENLTVTQLNDIYTESNITNWKPTSERNHIYAMEKYILPKLGKKKIKSVNNMMVQKDLINPFIREGFKKNSILSIYRRLNAIFTFAVKNEILDRKRFTSPNLNAADEGKKRNALSLDEVNLILETARKKHKITHYTALSLLFLTGMRAGELRALLWSDIDFGNRVIYINKTRDRHGSRSPKTRNSVREFPINGNIEKLLLAYKEWYDQKMKLYGFRNPLGCVFVTYACEPIGERYLKRIIDKMRNKNGIPFFTAHYFRHTFITIQLSNNIPVSTVAALVGDTPETVYKTYAHSFEKDEIHASNLMDEVVDLTFFDD